MLFSLVLATVLMRRRRHVIEREEADRIAAAQK
jgi:hypothetical protein